MRLKDKHFQMRAFILSSFSRLKIELSTRVYQFADKMIYEGWMPSIGSLEEIDKEIKAKYEHFLYHG